MEAGLTDHLDFGRVGETIGSEKSRSGGMKYRVVMWAAAGFLVACFWAVFFLHTRIQMTSTEPMWNVVRVTCPIAFLSFYPIKLYWALLANAATYALVGLTVETLRRQLRHVG
jgi:hypothetical protein